MQNTNDLFWSWGKVAISWAGAIVGSITLSKLVLFASLVLTCMQGYVLWRDKIKAPKQ